MSTLEDDARRLVRKYADLKSIEVGKVLRNMARDFVQGAYRETPLAKKSQSEFWYYRDKAGNIHYLHQDQLKKAVTGAAYTKTGKPRTISLKRYINNRGDKLRKVRIAKGWSKATWLGAMRDLGMADRQPPSNIPPAVMRYGEALLSQLDSPRPEIELEARIHFDALSGREQSITRAGWALARERFVKDYVRQVKKTWSGGK